MGFVFASTMDTGLLAEARRQCVQMIFNVVEKQRLPLSVATTASILFQRFYEEYTYADYDRFSVAVTACCLAAKVEFRSISLRELINACLHERYDREKEKERFSEEAILGFRKEINCIEQILLIEIINFDFDNIQGPHAALADLLAECKVDPPEVYKLHDVAWALANDSAYTSLSLQFPAQELARGLLYLASEWSGFDSQWLQRDGDDCLAVKKEVKGQMEDLYFSRSRS